MGEEISGSLSLPVRSREVWRAGGRLLSGDGQGATTHQENVLVKAFMSKQRMCPLLSILGSQNTRVSRLTGAEEGDAEDPILLTRGIKRQN